MAEPPRSKEELDVRLLKPKPDKAGGQTSPLLLMNLIKVEHAHTRSFIVLSVSLSETM